MKDPIQSRGGEVSIVIYDAPPLPPRYLRFSKKFIRTLFIVVPVAIGLCFLALLLLGLGSRIKETPAPSLPVVVSDEEAKVLELEAEVKGLKDSNQQLQEKLSGAGAAAGAPSQEEPFLMNIKKPYGMQNLMSENRVNLDQFDLVLDSNKTTLKFQIISTNPENRVMGHVLVFMISEQGLTAYPATANMEINSVKFSMGEPFAVSRLRPTNAEFNQKVTGESVKFVIYIFSREGDLLLIKETESYKTGNKS